MSAAWVVCAPGDPNTSQMDAILSTVGNCEHFCMTEYDETTGTIKFVVYRDSDECSYLVDSRGQVNQAQGGSPMTIQTHYDENAPRAQRYRVLVSKDGMPGSTWSTLKSFPTQREADAYGRGFWNGVNCDPANPGASTLRVCV